MRMLDDIISSATDGSASVAALLRSMQVLAARTGVRDLGSWVKQERDGYGKEDPLPTYRGPFPAQVLAHLSGGFGSEITNLEIPSTVFPDEFRALFELRLEEPVASMEALLQHPSEEEPSVPWPAEAVARANNLIHKGELRLVPMHGLVKVRQVVPRGRVVNALDGVRNRVLELALELEQVLPDLDDIPTRELPAEREKVSAVYNVVVGQGGQAIVGTNEVQQVHAEVAPGDTASLSRYLDGVRGLSDEQRAALLATVEEVETAAPEQKPGKARAALTKVGEIVGKAADQAVSIAVRAGMEGWLGPGAGA